MIVLTAAATVAPAAGGRWTVRDNGKRVSPFFATADEAGSFLTRYAPAPVASKAAGHVRSAAKPNADRRCAIRLSVGTTCMTCGKEGSWSRDDAGLPYALNLGHVIGENIGGTYRPGNVGAQHSACNLAAWHADRYDLTGEIVPGTVPTRWVATKKALDRADVRDVPPMVDGPDDDALRIARRRRGLSY